MRKIVDATDYENEQVVRNKKYKCLKQLEQMLHEKPALRESLKVLAQMDNSTQGMSEKLVMYLDGEITGQEKADLEKQQLGVSPELQEELSSAKPGPPYSISD